MARACERLNYPFLRPAQEQARRQPDVSCEILRVVLYEKKASRHLGCRQFANGSEVKLYRSTKDTRWFAFGSKVGWVMFPAEVAGWNKRQPTCGADLIDIREVPLCMGFDTGIPGAPMSTSAASALRLMEGGITEQRVAKKIRITCLTYQPKGCVGRCFFQAVGCAPLSKSAQERRNFGDRRDAFPVRILHSRKGVLV